MRLPELFGKGAPVYSFEFFLPKTPEEDADFKATVRELKALQPSFITLTYGAGGSARQRTIEMAGALKREIGIETAAHLTCIAHTRAEIRENLDRIHALGIENIVALRGDTPKDGTARPLEQRDYRYAVDLVAEIRAQGRFAVAVAGYPEGHPECPDREADLRHLQEKVAAGGDWVITQLFFDSADYFPFVARCRAAGIAAPIVPGIMPVTSFQQTRRFTTMCGARLPRELVEALEPIQEDREAVVRYGIGYAVRQCQALLDGGAPGVHFYTLNKSRSTQEILRRLRNS